MWHVAIAYCATSAEIGYLHVFHTIFFVIPAMEVWFSELHKIACATRVDDGRFPHLSIPYAILFGDSKFLNIVNYTNTSSITATLRCTLGKFWQSLSGFETVWFRRYINISADCKNIIISLIWVSSTRENLNHWDMVRNTKHVKLITDYDHPLHISA